jgi:hypothetical protein
MFVLNESRIVKAARARTEFAEAIPSRNTRSSSDPITM